MLPQSIASLFGLADNFMFEIMAVLALIWCATLACVVVRKASAVVRRSPGAGQAAVAYARVGAPAVQQ